MNKTPFVRRRGGLIELRLQPVEIDVLRPLLWQLRESIDAGVTSGELRRLYPPAYEDDPLAEEEFSRLTRDDLTQTKHAAIAAADATLERALLRKGLMTARLDEEEQQAWLGVLNDLRLVLGSRLSVTEEAYERAPVSADEQVYLYLGWLEEHLVEQLLA